MNHTIISHTVGGRPIELSQDDGRFVMTVNQITAAEFWPDYLLDDKTAALSDAIDYFNKLVKRSLKQP